MKKLLTLVLMVGVVGTALAQSGQKFTVKGTAYDAEAEKGAAYATVLITDSLNQLVASTYTADNGDFSLSAAKGDYVLKINFVGYAPYSKEIALTENVDLGKVTVSQLTEIEAVTAVGQLVTSDIDKTSYNTDLDPEVTTLTALEMMRKVPMLSVDSDETIRLRGETNFKILVNGKSSSVMSGNYKDVLRSMPASSIKRIEVITSPPAKYDAEGIGGIINIITNRKTIEGFNGSVWAGLDSQLGWNAGTYVAGSVGKFNFSGNLYVGSYNRTDNLSDVTITNLTSVDNYIQHFTSQSDNSGEYEGLSLEMSYEFDEKNLLTFAVNGQLGQNKSSASSFYEFFNQAGDMNNAYTNINMGGGNWGGVGASLDYQRTFDRPDQLFTVSYKVDYNPNNSDFVNDINPAEGMTMPALKSRGDNTAWGMEHAFQVDYFDPINEHHQIETGLKYTLRPSVSNSVNEMLVGDEWIENVAMKNDLDYMQHIASAYGAYQFKVKKFSVKAGARAEYTVNDGTYITQVNTPLFNEYFNIVPYLNLGFKIDDFQNLKGSYTQRITRPGIWLLNPYVDTKDPINVRTGNPNLDPELTHRFELSYGVYKPMFNITASLSSGITNNAIEHVATIGEESNLIRPENIGHKLNYGGALSAGARFFGGKLSVSFNGSAGYVDLSANNGSGQANSGFEYNTFAMISAQTWKDASVTLTGGCGQSGVSLQSNGFFYYFSGLSVNQGFFDKKLNVAINAQNPWSKYQYFSMSGQEAGVFTQTMNMRQFSQNIGLTLSWRFGSAKGFVKKARRTIDSSDQVGGGSAGSTGSSTSM